MKVEITLERDNVVRIKTPKRNIRLQNVEDLAIHNRIQHSSKFYHKDDLH